MEVLCDLACHLHRQLEKDALDLLVLRQPEEGEGDELLWKERLVWIGQPGVKIDKKKPIPLAVFPEPCFYRKIIANALGEMGLASKVTYTSSSSASVQEAVRAGLGVSVFAEGTILEDVHVLPRETGMPELPETCVVLHRAPKKHSLASERLAEYLINNLRPRASLPLSRTKVSLKSHRGSAKQSIHSQPGEMRAH